ncbi:putative Transcriptional regulator prz1 [Diplocarpon rosae]|nr:putative Transcriptional regulator prz1 [Diplocarpon rosae]
MDMTPQSSRSSASPYRYTSDPQPLYEYPSPAQTDSPYQSTDSHQDLGLYCYPDSTDVESSDFSTDIPPPPVTNNWPTNDLHSDPHRSAQSIPNIPSGEYDPFASFSPTVAAAYSTDIYSSYPAKTSILPAPPLLSGNTSHRSSLSSAPTSEIFTRDATTHSYTPVVKMEEYPEYISDHEGMLLSSPLPNRNMIVTSANQYPGSLEADFYQDHSSMEWPKVECLPQELPSISFPLTPNDRCSESQEIPRHNRRPSTMTRTRQLRKLTTKEDANFQCNIKGCGKLFGRSYNYKAHMETHDAGREYPFPCSTQDCNKKFVRKTDLQRHHQSVHMKERNHRCDYCGRFFARKDTLRRHMEDGCSKRFDIKTVDFQPNSYGGSDQNSMGVPSRPLGQLSRQASYSSSHHTPPTLNHGLPGHTLTSSSETCLVRPDCLAGKGGQETIWAG